MSADSTRSKIEEIYGQVSAPWELLIDLDLEFAEAFTDYLDAAYNSEVLEPRIRELLLLAHDASMTVLDSEGVTLRVKRSRDAGASEREVLDVLELLSMISTHSLAKGFPLALDPADYPIPESTKGGYWDAFEKPFPGFHGMLAGAAPRIFNAYRVLGRVLWRKDGLEPKWRELVLVVADMSTTHLYSDGAKLHIDNAIHYGATTEEVIAALALTTPFASRTIDIGMAALAEYREAEDRKDP